MITLDKFMRGVDEIVNSKPVYKSGGDGRAGGEIKDYAGSNDMYRNA